MARTFEIDVSVKLLSTEEKPWNSCVITAEEIGVDFPASDLDELYRYCVMQASKKLKTTRFAIITIVLTPKFDRIGLAINVERFTGELDDAGELEDVQVELEKEKSKAHKIDLILSFFEEHAKRLKGSQFEKILNIRILPEENKDSATEQA